MRTDVHRGKRVALALTAAAVACAALPLLAPFDPLVVGIGPRLGTPGAFHWFGTDELGRDVLSRVLYGTAATVSISVTALFSSLAIGVVAGALAGYYYERWPDRIFLWVTDFLAAIPFIILIASVLSLWGPGLIHAYIVLTTVIWASPARVMRAEVIQTLPREWVMADRVAGLSDWRIMTRKVMPQCMNSAMTFSLAYLPDVIALEAGLSFLGLGLQPPQPGLGKMIFDGMANITSAWWLMAAPAAALFLVVLAIRFVADSWI